MTDFTADPADKTEALARALMFAVVAPTDLKSRKAALLAERLAVGLPELEVARAKKMAQELVAEWDGAEQ